mmetsp:Transcript_21867/g.65381  ORF Transcript_21867/g.65381 Transcript_21867/m.65381 type:complete len:328 (-) Transcript_21867:1376-2359(-)
MPPTESTRSASKGDRLSAATGPACTSMPRSKSWTPNLPLSSSFARQSRYSKLPRSVPTNTIVCCASLAASCAGALAVGIGRVMKQTPPLSAVSSEPCATNTLNNGRHERSRVLRMAMLNLTLSGRRSHTNMLVSAAIVISWVASFSLGLSSSIGTGRPDLESSRCGGIHMSWVMAEPCECSIDDDTTWPRMGIWRFESSKRLPPTRSSFVLAVIFCDRAAMYVLEMSQMMSCPLMQPPATSDGVVGLKSTHRISSGALSNSRGSIGLCMFHTATMPGVPRRVCSTRSENSSFRVSATAKISGIVGCHATHDTASSYGVSTNLKDWCS